MAIPLPAAAAASRKRNPAIVRVVRSGAFVHFYLDCGHMITEREADCWVANQASEFECWACQAEREGRKGQPARTIGDATA